MNRSCRRRFYSCASLALLAAAAPARAQSRGAPSDTTTTAFVLGERHRFWSERLKQFREVIVSTPRSYAAGDRRYPVLFVLDGEENAAIAITASRHLAGAGKIPEMIVVAVVNADRERDFTPPLRKTSQLPPGISVAGGAADFIGYLGDELAPFVDARWRTRPLRVLVGHSLGGLVAMHALAVRPDLFRRYLTLDPSLWWDGGAELDIVRLAIAARSPAIARIAAVRGDSAELAGMFGAAPAGITVVPVPLEGEAHEFLMYRGLYDGLAALFDDYYPAMRHDAAKATVSALEAQYTKLASDFGYDVPIPMNSLLEVANREGNQRRFEKAREALRIADSLYPGSQTVAQFRSSVEESVAEAVREGLKEVVSRVRFRPVPVAAAARVLGTWRGRWYSRSSSFQPAQGTLTFELHGDTLVVQTVMEGIAMDGGLLREKPAIVELVGDALRWDRENNGGGRVLIAARLLPDGRITGRTENLDGHPLPAGFVPPEVLIELVRPLRK